MLWLSDADTYLLVLAFSRRRISHFSSLAVNKANYSILRSTTGLCTGAVVEASGAQSTGSGV